MPSPAYERFEKSRILDFDAWHDGAGFDLSAIAEMTADERASVRKSLLHADPTWREIEALDALRDYAEAHPDEDPGRAVSEIDRAMQRGATAPDRVTRLAAAETLHRQGKLPDFDRVIAREISDNMLKIADGCGPALLLAEQFPTGRVKQALLYASNFRSETAMHCAALLCYLCGKAKEPFDWSMRPFFMNFHENANSLTRCEGINELQALTGLTLQGPSEFL